jgi:hypothetical protein
MMKCFTALTPEMDCDQAAVDLPPVPSAVFLIVLCGKMWASWRSSPVKAKLLKMFQKRVDKLMSIKRLLVN